MAKTEQEVTRPVVTLTEIINQEKTQPEVTEKELAQPEETQPKETATSGDGKPAESAAEVPVPPKKTAETSEGAQKATEEVFSLENVVATPIKEAQVQSQQEQAPAEEAKMSEEGTEMSEPGASVPVSKKDTASDDDAVIPHAGAQTQEKETEVKETIVTNTEVVTEKSDDDKAKNTSTIVTKTETVTKTSYTVVLETGGVRNEETVTGSANDQAQDEVAEKSESEEKKEKEKGTSPDDNKCVESEKANEAAEGKEAEPEPILDKSDMKRSQGCCVIS
ncbi:protein IWS1 homolog [Rhopilema esculentum]|uniref:protein IWS1 homolog n=1 Tax=Rhopilema esculentum TaxID=499914 RepID=UPI0031D8F0D0